MLLFFYFEAFIIVVIPNDIFLDDIPKNPIFGELPSDIESLSTLPSNIIKHTINGSSVYGQLLIQTEDTLINVKETNYFPDFHLTYNITKKQNMQKCPVRMCSSFRTT